MNAKNINKEQFKEAIKVGFDQDSSIYKLYCPHVKVKNVEDIVDDISSRINKDVSKAVIKGVYEKNELIGYYVYDGKTLVSFALNIKYRTRKYLKAFWSAIRNDLIGHFQCYLWTANRRGINWLMKNDMKIINQDHLITHLIF